jgi:hypothetical protein
MLVEWILGDIGKLLTKTRVLVASNTICISSIVNNGQFRAPKYCAKLVHLLSGQSHERMFQWKRKNEVSRDVQAAGCGLAISRQAICRNSLVKN